MNKTQENELFTREMGYLFLDQQGGEVDAMKGGGRKIYASYYRKREGGNMIWEK